LVPVARDRQLVVVCALLIHQGEALRRACRPATSRVLWIESNGRAHVVTAREAVGKPHRDCYPLAEAVEGVRETIDALRRGTYEVWNGAKAVPIEELVAV
jgi:hypothetical protein